MTAVDADIKAQFLRLKRGSKHEFTSGARPSFGARTVSKRDGRVRETMQSISFDMRTSLPELSGGRAKPLYFNNSLLYPRKQRMDFLMSGHFFGASERGSGRHKVTLWRPEKMAAREKDTADAEIFGARGSER